MMSKKLVGFNSTKYLVIPDPSIWKSPIVAPRPNKSNVFWSSSGIGAIESIISARQDKPFSSLLDLCTRVDNRLVNKKTLESLIKAGAVVARVSGSLWNR